MDKILQIFISSTYLDLKEERQLAVQKLLESHCIPAGMELFTAQSKEQWEIIKNWIDKSDVYLLILGGRYGSIDKTTNLSYTEMEYDYAIKQKKPIISLVLSDKYLSECSEERKAIFELSNEKFVHFTNKVKSKMCKLIDKQEDIGFSIIQALNEIKNDEDIQLTGWVRGDFSKIEDKFKIGVLSFNEIHAKLSEKVYNDFPYPTSNKTSPFTALQIYLMIINCGNIYRQSKMDKVFTYLVYKVIPLYESLGLVEFKRVPRCFYDIMVFTKLGVKFNQLLLKFNEKI